MTDIQDTEFRLRVGQVTLGLVCSSAAYATSMARYFQTTCAAGKSDLQLTLNVDETDSPTEFPDNLFTAKSLGPDGFTIGEDLIVGQYDPQSRSGSITVKGILTKGQYTRIFEQFLYQAFYSARKILNYDAFLIHSSGVIRERNGQRDGFLFVGASEAGKSTVASLSSDKTITNDEMNLVEFTPDGPMLHATSFNGLFGDKDTDTRAPLRAIMLLNQGPEHRLDPVGQGEAVTLLASQVAPPIGIEDSMNQVVGLDLLELAHRLSTAAPVRKMTFLPDAGFWTRIDQAFPCPTDSDQGD